MEQTVIRPKHIGKYDLIEEIGRGGFAIVYKARDPSLNRTVALKVLYSAYASRADVAQRFLSEARQAASLRHKSIVSIYEAEEHEGQPYLAMEYLPGGALAHRLCGEPLAFDIALTILDQVADALDCAHRRKLVHRDIKPANILFDEEGNAVLVDFGLVKALVESGYTVDGTSLGTPHYMAPEQAQAGQVGAWTDVYALGVVTFEMLTGHVPFEADTPLAVLRAQVDTLPPDPCELNPSLESGVAAVVLKALAKSPAERFQSAGEFARALRQAWQSAQHVSQTRATLADQYTQLQEGAKAGRWGAVVSLCAEIRNIDPDYRDVGALLTVATNHLAEEEQKRQQERERGEQYEAALQLLAAGQFAGAVEALEQVQAQFPGSREVESKLGQARGELQRARWYDEAIAYAGAQRWDQACRTWLKVLRGRMDYHGGDAAQRLLEAVAELLERFDVASVAFHQQQRASEQMREALKLFDTLATAREAGDWAGVVNAAERLMRFAPDLQRPPAWLALARSRLAEQAGPGQDRLVWEKDGKEMVRVPAGEFLYGDDRKRLDLPEFWIDKTLVTNAEYKRFLDANPAQPVPFASGDRARPYNWDRKTRSYPEGKADHPVVLVSCLDAMAYAEWAGKRLPTEEEWEKAARGTDGREYPWGAWKKDHCNTSETGVGGTTPAGKYSPRGDSPFGCLDMAGNVWEWTQSNESGYRVQRGGNWTGDQSLARVAYRHLCLPEARDNCIGFRCVREGPVSWDNLPTYLGGR